jgi:hypothetical protein
MDLGITAGVTHPTAISDYMTESEDVKLIKGLLRGSIEQSVSTCVTISSLKKVTAT